MSTMSGASAVASAPAGGERYVKASHPSPGYVPPQDAGMMLVNEYALRVAPTDETVLLLGDTGVGKDVVARRIHQASPRSKKRFVHINCAALPEGLLESELFGHARGAFTGAVESQSGQFQLAAGGTVYLDEIGELSPRLQAKLLHALQEKSICPVGGREPLSIDVRFIAATNRDLDKAMADASFRRDLYYRLSVVTLTIPPLRERPVEMFALARFFAAKYATLFNRPALAELSESVLEAIREHEFHGNVRELENMIKRTILLGSYDVILCELADRTAPIPFPESISPERDALLTVPHRSPQKLREVTRMAIEQTERRAILSALTMTRWNRTNAAKLLDVSYRSLLYKIAAYAISPDPDEPVMNVHCALPNPSR